MALKLEDYGLIGDTQSAALVGADGSIDWLCLPRFDSGACFAALLGEPCHGRWQIAPKGPHTARQRYRARTLILETEFHTPQGAVTLVDFMPPRGRQPDVVRLVQGVSGRVELSLELILRFDYGRAAPWVRRDEGRLLAVAGPDAVTLATPVETRGHGLTTVADFAIAEGEAVPFVLTWHPSHEPSVEAVDPWRALEETQSWWEEWADGLAYEGEWSDAVLRSSITLKALTYAPTGGIVAAPTTSLPEQLGGVRNWDYRFCWVRDATLTLYSLLSAGYTAEAVAWREWLLRAVAGRPQEMQIMYGPAGERRLPELVLDWLPGYEGAAPVRIGNGATGQLQLDVFGEVMDTLHQARVAGIPPDEFAWRMQRSLLDFLEGAWREPDQGIWEVRSGRRHFTHSKVMAWVAFATARSRRWSAAVSTGQRSDGEQYGTRSTRRSAAAVTTPIATLSPAPTPAAISTPACS
jgi:GH15 family glucan-1,4-alpha-glucosidase